LSFLKGVWGALAWIIFDKETWQTVHKMRESGRQRKEHAWDKGPLNRFLYCPDCGSKLYFNHPSQLTANGTYSCGYHLHYKKCTSYYVRRDEWFRKADAKLNRLRAEKQNRLMRVCSVKKCVESLRGQAGPIDVWNEQAWCLPVTQVKIHADGSDSGEKTESRSGRIDTLGADD
jgi:hypothetical protein